jgi:hypothetical protein
VRQADQIGQREALVSLQVGGEEFVGMHPTISYSRLRIQKTDMKFVYNTVRRFQDTAHSVSHHATLVQFPTKRRFNRLLSIFAFSSARNLTYFNAQEIGFLRPESFELQIFAASMPIVVFLF